MNFHKIVYRIIFLILIIPAIINGQTYISPLLAIDGTAYGIQYGIYSGTIKYATSPAYGLKVEQQLSDRFRIGLQGYFSKKFIPYKNSLHNEGNNTAPFFPIYGFRMDNYNVSIQGYFYLLDSFRIGIGPSILSVGNFHSKWGNSENTWNKQPFPRIRQYGGLLQLGYEYHNFQLNLAYHRHVQPAFSSTLQLSLGYLIQVRGGKR